MERKYMRMNYISNISFDTSILIPQNLFIFTKDILQKHKGLWTNNVHRYQEVMQR